MQVEILEQQDFQCILIKSLGFVFLPFQELVHQEVEGNAALLAFIGFFVRRFAWALFRGGNSTPVPRWSTPPVRNIVLPTALQNFPAADLKAQRLDRTLVACQSRDPSPWICDPLAATSDGLRRIPLYWEPACPGPDAYCLVQRPGNVLRY